MMGKRIATIISTVFHPLLLPTLGLFVIFSTQSHLTFIPFEYRRLVTIIVFVSTCILPLSIMPLFLQIGLIKSLQMESTRERIIPLLTTAGFFVLGYFFLKKFPLPSFIPLFFLATIITVLLSILITFFWKISIHMVGIGGLLGAVISMALKYNVNTAIWVILITAIAGIIGSARLFLEAHNSKQVYAGFLLGLVVISFMIIA